MVDISSLDSCYELACRIEGFMAKERSKSYHGTLKGNVDYAFDPLAMTCLAELLYSGGFDGNRRNIQSKMPKVNHPPQRLKSPLNPKRR